MCARKKPPKFLPISSTPQPERRQPPQRRHSIEKETPTNVRQFLPPSRQSSRSLEEFCYPVECLALTVEEVMHIRQVLVKAELEKYQQYKDVYTALKKGKARVLTVLQKGKLHSVEFPVHLFATLPIPELTLTFVWDDRCGCPPSHIPLYPSSRWDLLPCKGGKVVRGQKNSPLVTIGHFGVSPGEQGSGASRASSDSSRRSLVLANKRARLKRKTQSFYMSSAGPSEYCPSERTINEI
ncbi:hypothetical protein U0070_005807 [Myodes glareolus]|uniref:Uncharacterized protein n=1 Tax=Myodes glareolus TaxID=447135 RepID=A0AAW0HMC9_MYOGA